MPPRHLPAQLNIRLCAVIGAFPHQKQFHISTPPAPRSVEAKMAMLVEAPAAVEDALASLLDHPEPLVQVGGWACSGVVRHTYSV